MPLSGRSRPAKSAKSKIFSVQIGTATIVTLCIVIVALLVLPIAYLTLQNRVGNVAVPGGRDTIGADRRVTFLTINDIYRLDGLAEGKIGGLTRVRTLRSWIERDAPNAILLHAGDFLSPSLASKVFKGEQMIDVLNNLDGDAKSFDSRMFVAFGNHEFDDNRCDMENVPLNARIDESRFTWLAANLDFPNCSSMSGILTKKNVRKDGIVLDVNNVKVGIFGIGQTPDKEGAPKYPHFEESIPAARRSIDYLRSNGAQLIVALTHLPREDDEALLREFSAAGLDLLVGGHDHSNMVLFDGQGQARGFKADSDARSAWRIDVYMSPGSRPRVEAQLIALNEAIPPDADLAKRAKSWAARAETVMCTGRAKDKGEPVNPDCLSERIGRTQSMIELEETANRSAETGIGDWLGDLIVRETGADMAIVNSGMLGLNEDLAPGTSLSLRHVVDIIRFDGIVAVRSFPAKQVCAAVAHGLLRPGSGAWPHLGGVEVEVKRSQGRNEAAAVTRFVGKPGVTCESDTPIKVAAPPFLLCGGDEYPLRPGSDQCYADLHKEPFGSPDAQRPARTFGALVEAAIRAAGNAGIRPEKDGRLQFTESNGAK